MEIIITSFLSILLFESIPESTAIVTFAFVITKIPLNLKNVLLLGIVHALIVDCVRALPIPFGIHTIIAIILLSLYCILYGKVDLSLAIIAGLSSVLVLGVEETIFISFIYPHFNLTPKSMLIDNITIIVTALPQTLGLFAIAFLVKKKLFYSNQNINAVIKRDII